MHKTYEGFGNFSGAMVITQNAPLFTSPDTQSAVIYRAHITDSVKISETGTDEQVRWYKVTTGSHKGYMRLQDLALNSVRQHAIIYCLQFPGLPGKDDSVRIFSYDTRIGAFTDTIYYGPFGSESFTSLSLVKTNLKNTRALLKISKIMPFCGGGELDIYFADTGNKLVHVLDAFSGGDINDMESTIVWWPVPDKNSTVLNAGIFPYTLPDGSMIDSVVKIPPGLKPIPLETVVVRKYSQAWEYDENDEPVKDENGTERDKITADKTEFFRWDGKKLISVKTIVRIKN